MTREFLHCWSVAVALYMHMAFRFEGVLCDLMKNTRVNKDLLEAHLL